MAHNDIENISELTNYFDDDFSIFIHLDKRGKFTADDLKTLKSKKNVFLISQKYKINRGGFKSLKAELFLMKKALHHGDYDYFHLISGQDYPTKSIGEFKYFFKETSDAEYIVCKKIPSEWATDRLRFFQPYDYFDCSKPKGSNIINRITKFQQKRKFYRKPQKQFDALYEGSEWFSLTKNAVRYILDYTSKNPGFYNRLKYTMNADRTYIHTVLANSVFKEKINNENLRYINRGSKNNSFHAILDESDFFKILGTDALFARSVDRDKSKELIKKLNYRISHPAFDNYESFNIDENGSFNNNFFKGHSYDRELGEALCLFSELMEVKTIVDLGCGPGWYVKALRDAGFSVDGFDGNPHTGFLSDIIMQDGTSCNQIDLTEENVFNEKYDMVLSLEVGEHIPKKFEDVYISNLLNNCKKYLIVSWAIENQKGDGHVNCRHNKYIIDKITRAGYIEIIPIKNYLRYVAELEWFKNTILVFQKL